LLVIYRAGEKNNYFLKNNRNDYYKCCYCKNEYIKTTTQIHTIHPSSMVDINKTQTSVQPYLGHLPLSQYHAIPSPSSTTPPSSLNLPFQ